jgi:hypothetical protein
LITDNLHFTARDTNFDEFIIRILRDERYVPANLPAYCDVVGDGSNNAGTS